MKEVSPKVNSDQLERELLEYWQKAKIFEQTLKKTEQGKLFTFYDGPPYATGKPHYGHVLQSAIKDTVLRFKTMQGYYAPRRVGWDCHGLPVETLVEKELGFKSKKDIEQFGIERFNKKCKEVVFRYIDVFTDTLRRMGRWADYEHGYATLDRSYMESEWWVFKQLWDQDLVYKAFRSTPYCIRCATPLSNFEVSSNYKDKDDVAVYVLLAVKDQPHTFLAVWTTTPWTLPGNAGVAVHPEIDYVIVEHEGKLVVMAKARVEAVFGKEARISRAVSAKELLGWQYEPVYSFLPAENAYRVVAGAHVTDKDGTGLVHIAPAFGEEDAQIGVQYELPVLKTVDTTGRFVAEVTPWQGQNIFEASRQIVADLKTKGVLLKQEHYRHSYPFCWRCDTPLIYYALDTWFIRITKLKDRLLKINQQIDWVPEHVKHGRFAKGIESAPDWAVSRNRFWSVPMPIWECDQCQERVCVGSIAELEQASGRKNIADLHRPYVDEIGWQCDKCSGQMRRVPEVLDVWFDSGSMPYSQWHYPFENKELVEGGFPADFIAESIEMTRAWFYVLHVLATALTTKNIGLGKDKPAFSHAIASGLIFAQDGQKLSKKLKNYPEIEPTLERYGADVLRFYLLTSSSLGEPYRFSEKEMQYVQRNTYLTLWNVYSFFTRYAMTHGWQPSKKATKSRQLLDRWIMARLAQLTGEVTYEMERYRIDTAARLFINFIDDLSNWYVRRSRSRFQHPEDGQRVAFATLSTVLVRLSEMLAPFMPFLSEEMYRNLTDKDSVHLNDWPKRKALTAAEKKLLEAMDRTRQIVSAGLAARAEHKIKVRQPLSELTVISNKELSSEFTQMIAEEVNVDTVTIKVDQEASDDRVTLDATLTPQLRDRGLTREIIRHGQILRREAGYGLNDQIDLIVRTASNELDRVVKTQHQTIVAALRVRSVVAEGSEDAGQDISLSGQNLHLGVRKTS